MLRMRERGNDMRGRRWRGGRSANEMQAAPSKDEEAHRKGVRHEAHDVTQVSHHTPRPPSGRLTTRDTRVCVRGALDGTRRQMLPSQGQEHSHMSSPLLRKRRKPLFTKTRFEFDSRQIGNSAGFSRFAMAGVGIYIETAGVKQRGLILLVRCPIWTTRSWTC